MNHHLRPGSFGMSPAFVFQPGGLPVQALGHLAGVTPLGLKVAGLPKKRLRSANRTLTILGHFNNPWTTHSATLDALNSGIWSPSTVDFAALASNSGVKKTATVDSLLAFIHLILDQPEGSIRRINIITHGNSSGIGFGGTIDLQGDVDFFSEDMLTEENLLELFRYRSLDGFNNPVEHFILYKKKKLRFDSVRKRFAPDAEIFVYACKVGANKDILKAMAHAFWVTVHGFDAPLDYYIPDDLATPTVDRKNLLVAKHVGPKNKNTAATDGVRDFHELTPNIQGRPSDVYIFPGLIERASP